MVKESIPNTNMEMQRALKSLESWAGSFIESVIQEKQPTLALPHKYNATASQREYNKACCCWISTKSKPQFNNYSETQNALSLPLSLSLSPLFLLPLFFFFFFFFYCNAIFFLIGKLTVHIHCKNNLPQAHIFTDLLKCFFKLTLLPFSSILSFSLSLSLLNGLKPKPMSLTLSSSNSKEINKGHFDSFIQIFIFPRH